MHWQPPQYLQYPYAPVEELYTNVINSYPRAPHIFLGFPTRYVQGRGTITEWHRKKAKKHPGRIYVSYMDVQFMSSRDGRTFHRWNEAFLSPGMPEEERWGYGTNFQNWGIVETKSELGVPQLSFYVTEGNREIRDRDEHQGVKVRFRRYTLRIDGFVSVNAPLKGGEMVTHPVVFEGNELAINFSTSAAGSVRVEIQNEDGEPLDGYTLDECAQIFGNEIEHIVKWENGEGVSKLSGKPVRLRFELRDAHLYSIKFRN
jgi:hypothetical protein